MNVTELRIGNLVFSKQFNEQRIVGLIGNGNWLSYKIEGGGLDGAPGIVDAQPIRLTEDWLFRFGGELDENGHVFIYENKENDIRYYIDGEYLTRTKGVFIPIVQLKHIKYVNQLQNLYFALTGNELILTN